ncbi:hypothetical protein [Enterococcus canintestini]|uniref:Uncharacterized protein n=1 Tax=Enterococcus canintestini TaxID=317010 RepID=A0A267HPM1_9ENTE|nr:hypothetical protein [Enterococcus canintestini]PAB00284.1 hypothetical protein AKL21_09845 [Enterococcus canintestini]
MISIHSIYKKEDTFLIPEINRISTYYRKVIVTFMAQVNYKNYDHYINQIFRYEIILLHCQYCLQNEHFRKNLSEEKLIQFVTYKAILQEELEILKDINLEPWLPDHTLLLCMGQPWEAKKH